jgi:hypothetical protein
VYEREREREREKQSPEDLLLSNISQARKDKCYMISLIWECRQVDLIKAEGRIVVVTWWGDGRHREIVNRYKLSCGMNKFWVSNV